MTTIPNTVTNEQLLAAMQNAVEPALVLFGGKTLEEVRNYLRQRTPEYDIFGSDASVVNKINILNELILLHNHHKRMVDWYKQQGPESEKAAQDWEYDEKKVLMLIHSLMGVALGDKDPYYQEQSTKATFIGELSDESIEVFEHFGNEAAALLNQYACAVEDALIEQVKRNNELKKELAALKGEPEPELLNTNIAQSEMAGKLKEILANKN